MNEIRGSILRAESLPGQEYCMEVKAIDKMATTGTHAARIALHWVLPALTGISTPLAGARINLQILGHLSSAATN